MSEVNLAVVIAVNKYNDDVGDLPGCVADGKGIEALIGATSKFSDLIVLCGNEPSAVVKEKIAAFIEKYKAAQVNEVFFYYSGHGLFANDEFYYLLSDFTDQKRRQTSLENSELDRLLRTLSPKLTVKIVDACNSGIAYVKDASSLDSYLKGTQPGFAKCYFMFSSQSNQASYADNVLSFFTRSVISSVREHLGTEVRYKDIIDYVADAFSTNDLQTPRFVIQADLVEHFCSIDEELKSRLDEVLSREAPKLVSATIVASGSRTTNTLYELVKTEAGAYGTEADAEHRLEDLKSYLSLQKVPDELNEMYSARAEFSYPNDYSALPDPTAIGTWVNDNPDKAFAEPYRKSVSVTQRVRKSSMYPSPMLYVSEADYEDVTRQELKIKGFRSTFVMPYLHATLYADPTFPNLQRHALYVVPLLSQTQFTYFGL